jgi:hypothetical protein
MKIIKRCVEWEWIPVYDAKDNIKSHKRGQCLRWEYRTEVNDIRQKPGGFPPQG